MPSVEEHYKKLLSPCYSWIQGGADRQLDAYRTFFRRHAVNPVQAGSALDLGAGSGFQSIPLAELGFKVVAIDTSRELLAELRRRAGKLAVTIIHDDLMNFTRHSPQGVELIVCMGDTLTHLHTLQDVRLVIRRAKSRLAAGGRLFLGFRDMCREVKDLDRFVTVRSDSDRIFTCFLEYGKRHVRVHDLLYERSGQEWLLHKSFYRKLKIPTDWLREQIEKAGLVPEHLEIDKGITTIIARRT